MMDYLTPWRRRRAAQPERIDVGILAASGDVVVMYPGEGIPRRYPAALARAIAEQVNAHGHVYAVLDEQQKAPDGAGA
ncbi:MAG: hypothetical protein RL260_1918 [Pseudomonadota bacterium]|jgi:hypothetical protein